METIKKLKRSIFILGCFLVYTVTVTSLGPLKPTAIDYAISRISQRQKEEFVDEHNKYRSSVDPPAANMEYMVWDDDLGNLAQMWANKCTWDHGFLEFGDVYPNAPFKGQVGQNLAREWGRLHIPSNRVKLWYTESKNFSFSRVSSSDVRNQCSKPPCKRYTQLVWASTKYVGCGFSFCDKTFGKPHPWVKGETEVVCNYAPGGNVIDHFPYEVGKPCSKCASGNGFCYKNLCRDCNDFDPECGKSLTREMCSAFKEAMAKRCPKMCNLCECPLQCQNGGKLNRLTCTCECLSGWIGLDCSVQCVDKAGQEVCHLRISNGHQCRAPYMKHECATTCRVCGNTPATNPVFGFNIATSKPPVFQQLSPTLADLPNRLPNHGELQTSAIPSSDLPFMQAKTSSMQSVSHSKKTSNKTSSFPPNSPSSSPFNVKSVEAEQAKETFKDMSSKIKSSGKEQVVKCKDDDPKCRMWSVLGICKKKTPTWLKKHCSCGMCNQSQVDNRMELCMDNNVKCPFWASNGECSRDRVWMLTNCRRSCNQCGVCKDAWPNCAEVALQDSCTVGNSTQFMLTHCRQSCGLCQAYDIYDHCPAWAAQGNCKNSNWTWMRDNCPLSCGIPLTEVQYCWDKKDGNYPIPGICTGYVLCSGRLTRHVVCPAGTLFNAVKMICELP